MYNPHFLDLGTSWRWVVSLTPRPLYPRGKNHRYPLDKRLGGTQCQSERHGDVKILTLTGNRTPTPLKTVTISVIDTILDLSIFISLLIRSSILQNCRDIFKSRYLWLCTLRNLKVLVKQRNLYWHYQRAVQAASISRSSDFMLKWTL
jgi:hypothetical protein